MWGQRIGKTRRVALRTHAWKFSAFRGTMKARASTVLPEILKPRATSFSETSSDRRGRNVIPRWGALSPNSDRKCRLSASYS